MAFASLDFLAIVKPSFCATHLGGLDRLTIQTPRRGMFVPLLLFSDARTECIVNSDPYALEFPGSQVMIDALPLGESGGQHAPLDPAFGHIKDGIEYGPHLQGTRASTAFGSWDQIFDPLPFLVGQVAWIYFFVHIPILHNPRRLFRQALSGYDNHKVPGIIGLGCFPWSAIDPCPILQAVHLGGRKALEAIILVVIKHAQQAQ